MKQLQFGTKAALSAATPKAIKLIYRLIMLLSSVWGFASVGGYIQGLTDHAMLLINGWLMIGNYAFYQFCQMFGYAEATPETREG